MPPNSNWRSDEEFNRKPDHIGVLQMQTDDMGQLLQDDDQRQPKRKTTQNRFGDKVGYATDPRRNRRRGCRDNCKPAGAYQAVANQAGEQRNHIGGRWQVRNA